MKIFKFTSCLQAASWSWVWILGFNLFPSNSGTLGPALWGENPASQLSHTDLVLCSHQRNICAMRIGSCRVLNQNEQGCKVPIIRKSKMKCHDGKMPCDLVVWPFSSTLGSIISQQQKHDTFSSFHLHTSQIRMKALINPKSQFSRLFLWSTTWQKMLSISESRCDKTLSNSNL